MVKVKCYENGKLLNHAQFFFAKLASFTFKATTFRNCLWQTHTQCLYLIRFTDNSVTSQEKERKDTQMKQRPSHRPTHNNKYVT